MDKGCIMSYSIILFIPILIFLLLGVVTKKYWHFIVGIIFYTILYFTIYPNFRIKRIGTFIYYMVDKVFSEKPIKIYIPEEIKNVRASIYNGNRILISYSEPIYKVLIHNNLDSRKFSFVFSDVYSIIGTDKISSIKRISNLGRNANFEYLPISFNVTKEEAEKLSIVASKYKNIPIKNKEGKRIYKKVIDIKLSGYNRIYPLDDFFSPFIGHTRKSEDSESKTFRMGVEGIEGYYEKKLSSKSSNQSNLNLNIDYTKQIVLQLDVDMLKRELKADEVSAIYLNLDTGEVKALATSDRFDMNSVSKNNYKKLNPSVTTLLFNPEDFLFPIEEALTLENNTNMLMGLSKFGLLRKSGIDLAFEQKPIIDDSLKINFMQLFKAYTVFYNEGILSDIKIAKNTKSSNKNILDPVIANTIRDELKDKYKYLENKELTLDFGTYKKKANIEFRHFYDGFNKHLYGYFIINKKGENNE
jgi:cell division protein FtsI/penicillin-binding protein 2